MAGDGGSSDRMWLAFSVSSVLCLAVLAVSPIKDHFREYRSFQQDYQERLVAAAGTSRELRQARQETVRVRQLWIPDLGNHVDRCVSCHLGVGEPRMADAPQPFRLHPTTPHTPHGFARFGCVSCHRGQGRATSMEAAHGEVEDWDRPMLPTRYTEASCGTCHLGDEVPEADLLSKGRALIRRAGCHGCHRLPGGETWESVAPDLDGLAEKTYPQWLVAWLLNPQSLRPEAWMPDFQLREHEAEALLAFLWLQEPRVRLDGRVPAELPAGDYDRGRRTFREARCISCHTVEGRGNGSAPELSGIGSKVNRRWLFAFLQDPHAFQPRTAMPGYLFDEQELADLTQYLMEEMVDPDAPPPGEPYRPDHRLADEGKALYRRYGCGGCHRLAGEEAAGKIGPDLTAIGDRPAALLDFGGRSDLPRHLPDWLTAKVIDPRSFRDGLKMPRFTLEEDEVTAVITALLSYTGETIPESYRIAAETPDYSPPGRFGELVRTYRCMSCHQIQGAGGDISTAPLGAEGSKVQRDWLEHYLLLPVTIRPILTDRMIPLGMPAEEASFIADFVSNVYLDDRIPGEIFPQGVPPQKSERGRRLFFERYGCQACHQVEGTGGYYGPPLDDTPGKLRSGWIAWWLQGPQRWRRDVRCPDYGMEAEDAHDLAAFLITLGTVPAEEAAARGGSR